MEVRPYTRSLDPADYAYLQHVGPLRYFEQEMTRHGVPHREWHEYRLWEYASIMQQLDELAVPKDATILDVGSGGSFFPPYLVTVGGYANAALTDSMAYGDIFEDVRRQREHYCGAALPLFDLPVENMVTIADGSYDVVMCISTIEHVEAAKHDDALRELLRVTKPGGLLFITSDYFRDVAQWEASPSRHVQHTAYTKDTVLSLPSRVDADFVGETDLDYRGDFVHNYSFCNICLRRAS
jgi:SAM-dependent methyltransferase